jgi:glucose/arabinose dehydrogenase
MDVARAGVLIAIKAAFSPGVALGPDGATYVSDDQGGRVWRIVQR